MEWKVVNKIFPTHSDLQILKVTASGNLKFIIWTKSNFRIALNFILTPVIDGYIANHNKGHFVVIMKAVPYSKNHWEILRLAQKTTLQVNEDKVIIHENFQGY